jgi:hypothetical protein
MSIATWCNNERTVGADFYAVRVEATLGVYLRNPQLSDSNKNLVVGTRTWETLCWRGPAAYIKDRPVLSSERAPHKNRTVTVEGLDTKTYRLTGRQSQCDFDFDFDLTDGYLIPRQTGRLTVGRNITSTLTLSLWVRTPRGGGFEYLHRSPASRRRRRKRNPVPGHITGPPCSWGI